MSSGTDALAYYLAPCGYQRFTHPPASRWIVGCTPDWVRKLLKRYNAEGEAALRDKRKNNTGVRFLDETQQAALAAALSAPPGDGGLWTGPKVAAWISETLQRRVSDVSGWKYLKRLGYTNTSSATSGSRNTRGAANI